MEIVIQLGKQNFFNTHCVLHYFYKNIGVRPSSLKIATQKLFQGKSLKCVCLKSLKIYCSVCFCAEKNIYVSETELPNKARSATMKPESLWGFIWYIISQAITRNCLIVSFNSILLKQIYRNSVVSQKFFSRPFEMTKGSKLSLTGAAFPSKFEFANACLTSKQPQYMVSDLYWKPLQIFQTLVEKSYTSNSTWESLSLQDAKS